MARCTPRWVIGTLVFAVLLTALPAVTTLLAPDATSLTVAAVVVVALCVLAAVTNAVPVPALVRLARSSERAPDRLARQSDPSAAGHSRPRAPATC